MSWSRMIIGTVGALLVTALPLDQDALAEEKTELQNAVTAYVEAGETESEGVVTLWMANVNPLSGITLPFKFAPGGDSLHLDSLVVVDGRASHFLSMRPSYKPENQTLLAILFLLVDSTRTLADVIPPGEGMLARLFFSAEKKFPVEAFRMVHVQLPPHNVLSYVTDEAITVLPEFALVRKPAPEWPPVKKSEKSP